MKKYLLVLSLSAVCFACGNSSEPAKTNAPAGETPAAAPAKEAASADPDYDKGLNLVAKSDCLGCHKLHDQSIGPSYAEVAKKYEHNEANQTMLAEKIMKGGQGVWGSVPMAAHPGLSKEDAVQMVKYIFLIKD